MRIEIGEKELTGKLTLFLRDLKSRVPIILKDIPTQGQELDKRLREKADKKFHESITDCKTLDEVKSALASKKIARCNFCSLDKEGEKCAEAIEKKLLAFVRGERHDKKEKPKGKCIICNKKAEHVVYIAKSY